jgi:hypothetical protein
MMGFSTAPPGKQEPPAQNSKKRKREMSRRAGNYCVIYDKTRRDREGRFREGNAALIQLIQKKIQK